MSCHKCNKHSPTSRQHQLRLQAASCKERVNGRRVCVHKPVAWAIAQHEVVVVCAVGALAGSAEDVCHVHLPVAVVGVLRDHLVSRHL